MGRSVYFGSNFKEYKFESRGNGEKIMQDLDS